MEGQTALSEQTIVDMINSSKEPGWLVELRLQAWKKFQQAELLQSLHDGIIPKTTRQARFFGFSGDMHNYANRACFSVAPAAFPALSTGL